jgi:LysM repeat protein
MNMKAILLTALFALSGMVLLANPADSIGRRAVDGKNHVIHRIEKGETLFGLSRKYGVTADEIKKANPGIENGFNIGREILIPRKWNGTPVAQTPAPTPPVDKPAMAAPATRNTIHTVTKGETLNAIARKYGITVAELKADNNLSSDNVRIGQELVIKTRQNGTTAVTEERIAPIVTGSGRGTGDDGPRAAIKPAESTDPGIPAESVNRREPETTADVDEEGKATLITRDGIDQNRNYILHPSARIGTIVMLTNPVTNVRVFARVIGNYRPADQPGVAVQVTRTVSDVLASGSGDFKVKINYAR